jgi:hypothetical protein
MWITFVQAALRLLIVAVGIFLYGSLFNWIWNKMVADVVLIKLKFKQCIGLFIVLFFIIQFIKIIWGMS